MSIFLFAAESRMLSRCCVSSTGSILLDLSVEDLLEMGLQSRVQGRWVMQQVLKLRRRADVSFLDPENVSKFLVDIHKDLTVYRVDFARQRITTSFLPHLNQEMLTELGVRSSIDQTRILNHIRETCDSVESTDSGSPGSILPLTSRYRKKYDVFISYRRESGSQLASLLKVYLEVRGLSTFLDVTSLGGGKFDEALLTNRPIPVLLVQFFHSLPVIGKSTTSLSATGVRVDHNLPASSKCISRSAVSPHFSTSPLWEEGNSTRLS
jgi:hypothetical protein